MAYESNPLTRRQLMLSGLGAFAAPRLLAASGFGTPPAITTAPRGTAAFVGTCASGPVNQPILVNSFLAFSTQFGSAPSGTLPYPIYQYFNNGGQQCYVVRVADDHPTTILGQPGSKTGIYALTGLADWNILAFPGVIDANLWKASEAFCAARQSFLILDAPNVSPAALPTELNTLAPARSSYAAIYYPWLTTPSLTQATKTLHVPPSGAVAGIYATTDQNRGVWKAPAGPATNVTGVTSLTQTLSTQERGVLNGQNVNCLATMPNAGPVVWGARTFQNSTDSHDYEYINARRFTCLVEQSIMTGLAWIRFQPNGAPLWSQIRLSINTYLMQLYHQGAILGTTPATAFFVKCDSTTTSPSDISNGRLNVIIGLALYKPAEFTIIKLTLLTG